MGKMDEKILVVDRQYLFANESLAFQGFLTDEELVKKVRGRLNAFYEAKRGQAEYDERKKQPIPYVVILRGDEIFLYERLSAGGEERLHGQLSIGVGGHMNLLNDNCRWTSNVKENMYRELHEEVRIVTDGDIPEPKFIGLINDDETDSGKVHIGVIYFLELPADAEVTVKETDKLDGYWVRLKDITKPPLYQGLESWSQMIASELEHMLQAK